MASRKDSPRQRKITTGMVNEAMDIVAEFIRQGNTNKYRTERYLDISRRSGEKNLAALSGRKKV